MIMPQTIIRDLDTKILFLLFLCGGLGGTTGMVKINPQRDPTDRPNKILWIKIVEKIIFASLLLLS